MVTVHKTQYSIPPQYKAIADRIYSVCRANGYHPMYTPEDFGLSNELKTEDGTYELVCDDYSPRKVVGPEGSISLGGCAGRGCSRRELFQALHSELNFTEVYPHRSCDPSYQPKIDLGADMDYAGPIVRINNVPNPTLTT